MLGIGDFIARQGVVWGDVKPGNLVYFRDPWLQHQFRLKAIDFDSSCCLAVKGTSIPAEYDARALATPGYISPERASR